MCEILHQLFGGFIREFEIDYFGEIRTAYFAMHSTISGYMVWEI